jgi:hypothetical protein
MAARMRIQQYGAACAPDVSQWGMQDCGRLWANDTIVAAASASASVTTSFTKRDVMAISE